MSLSFIKSSPSIHLYTRMILLSIRAQIAGKRTESLGWIETYSSSRARSICHKTFELIPLTIIDTIAVNMGRSMVMHWSLCFPFLGVYT